ncbi:structural protein [Arsenophonus nasoniae]|uniref:Structural protein n=1 Tax=Arsenophonus nasoniae TaxID=638 RepID=A0AA95GAV5_9GAMM|nr:structural protein [Arsenophonus nasoniae]WGL93785.1 structural protein [Arsenophonus nasoniae]WGL96003.1 structural protein [Arsenophonus nasoniae]
MISRGIRNNNPGNIDYNPSNNWCGQLEHDPAIESRFCRFASAEYGIRAIMCLLRTYQRKYHCDSVFALINRYASDIENDTSSYVKSVCNALSVNSNEKISTDDKKTLITMTKAIIQHENGQQPYSDNVFEKAYSLI